MVPSTGNHQFIIVRADNVLIAPLSALNLAFRSLNFRLTLSKLSLMFEWWWVTFKASFIYSLLYLRQAL